MGALIEALVDVMVEAAAISLKEVLILTTAKEENPKVVMQSSAKVTDQKMQTQSLATVKTLEEFTQEVR